MMKNACAHVSRRLFHQSSFSTKPYSLMMKMLDTRKRKTLLLSIALLLLAAFTGTTVQAKKPLFDYSVVQTIVDEGPFGDAPEFYAKSVMHQTLIINSANWEEGTIEVIMHTVQIIRLYELTAVDDDYEPRELLILLRITQKYVGTLIPDIPSGGWVTGKMIMDWVFNPVGTIEFPPNLDLRGHWIIRYEEGEEVNKIGFGVPPFNNE